MKDVRVLDLDGSLAAQGDCFAGPGTTWLSAREWGPTVRLACSFRTFSSFQHWLSHTISAPGPSVTLYGSGDFHHVTLALLCQIRGPFNLLVLDKHPDWMRGIPFLHCGTWLYHALRLPGLNRVYHCGGDLDFDNAYRWLAPWPEIASGRVVVFPARRRFVRGRWAGFATHPLQTQSDPMEDVLGHALHRYLDDLARFPLYISVDKDVLTEADAAVNWDSGLLRTPEAVTILRTFLAAAGGRLAGADVLGDWSPIELERRLNRLCHRIDHPSPDHDPLRAAEQNRRANQALLQAIQESTT